MEDGMKPFEIKELKEKNSFQKIFKKQPSKNVLIEINNLFATKLSIKEISKNDINRILLKYKVNLEKQYTDEVFDIFSEYINANIEDCKNRNVIDDFNKIIELLEINNELARKRIDEISLSFLKDEINKIISSGKINNDDEKYLGKLKNNLSVNENSYKELYDSCGKNAIQELFNNIISDGRVTPIEEHKFKKFSEDLDTSLTLSPKAQALYEKGQKIWKIENGDIGTIEADIFLQKNECCYSIKPVGWHEIRTITTGVRYAGPTLRIKIMKGFYYRLGDFNTERKTQDKLVKLDDGKMYLTNKRILFSGSKKNYSIPYSRIIDFELFNDGVKIVKDSGRNIIATFNDDIEIFGAILAKLLSQQ